MKILFMILSLLIFLSSNANELFVKYNNSQNHYAVAGNQIQYNQINVFRFFDLNQGNTQLKLINQSTGSSSINITVQIKSGHRVIIEFDELGEIQMLQYIPIQTNNWYTSNTSTNTSVNITPVNNNDSFKLFLQEMDKESFDSNKLNLAKKYINKTMLSTHQIGEIARKFYFDSYRLDWSKYAYNRCIDPENYFLLKPYFTFQSNYNLLEEYIDED